MSTDTARFKTAQFKIGSMLKCPKHIANLTNTEVSNHSRTEQGSAKIDLHQVLAIRSNSFHALVSNLSRWESSDNTCDGACVGSYDMRHEGAQIFLRGPCRLEGEGDRWTCLARSHPYGRECESPVQPCPSLPLHKRHFDCQNLPAHLSRLRRWAHAYNCDVGCAIFLWAPGRAGVRKTRDDRKFYSQASRLLPSTFPAHTIDLPRPHRTCESMPTSQEHFELSTQNCCKGQNATCRTL
jgi:hypothetical protein